VKLRLRDIYIWRVFSCTAALPPHIDPLCRVFVGIVEKTALVASFGFVC
jgi:hypothetical protein